MRSTLALLLVLGLGFGAGSVAMADSPAIGSATNWFKSHDRDNDGYLTADEVIGYELKLMKRADKSGDGKLSLREFIAGIPPDQPDEIDRYRRRFKAMDADHDGFVTPDEMTSFYRFLLKTSDTGGDGRVSLQEWLGATEGE
jgi:Ca2+-binding EF-hand superfamily protein